jgi:hypothetical protein
MIGLAAASAEKAVGKEESKGGVGSRLQICSGIAEHRRSCTASRDHLIYQDRQAGRCNTADIKSFGELTESSGRPACGKGRICLQRPCQPCSQSHSQTLTPSSASTPRSLPLPSEGKCSRSRTSSSRRASGFLLPLAVPLSFHRQAAELRIILSCSASDLLLVGVSSNPPLLVEASADGLRLGLPSFFAVSGLIMISLTLAYSLLLLLKASLVQTVPSSRGGSRNVIIRAHTTGSSSSSVRPPPS